MFSLTTSLNQKDGEDVLANATASQLDVLANATTSQLQDYQPGPAQLQIAYHGTKFMDGVQQEIEIPYLPQPIVLK